MAKRKTINPANRSFTEANYYDGGSWLSKSLTAGKNMNPTKGAGILGASNAVGALGNRLLSNGLESGAGNAIAGIGSSVGSAVGAFNPVAGAIINVGSGIIGGGVNALFGSKMNQENINDITASNRALNTLRVEDSSNSSILNQWANQDFGRNFTQSDIGRDGVFSSKAKKKYNQLRQEQEAARNRALNTYSNAIDNADANMDFNLLSNYMSAGGDLHTNGTVFDNGLTYVNEGDTHEENPMGGVLMGMDTEGTPNLVEEGEVIYNDYVFSNRLKADKELLDMVKLPKNYAGKTFADIAKKLGKDSEERPNDPISKAGLEDAMLKLQMAQEYIRQKDMKKNNSFSIGGKVKKFDGRETDHSMSLYDPTYDYSPAYMDYYLANRLPNVTVTANKSQTINGQSVDDIDWDNVPDYSVNNPNARRKTKLVDTEDEVFPMLDYKRRPTWMRYAPIAGAALGLGWDLLSKPDYSNADAILEAATEAGTYTPVGYKPIGNYLQYRPFDRNYWTNRLNAEAGATRRAVMNTTSPSRYAALLAADHNAQTSLGELARQAEEYNWSRRKDVEDFNRATNQANSEMALKADLANAEASQRAKSARLSGITSAMTMRNAIDDRRSANISANWTNLFESLGNIGIDNYNKNDRDFYLLTTSNPISVKPQNMSDELWEELKKYWSSGAKKAYKKGAKGGYLTINKRRKK